MKAVYVQRGENLDFRNDTGEYIKAGDVVVFGNRIGVAGTDIPPGELGSIHMTEVYRLPKKAGEAVSAGMDVYYTPDGITASAETGTVQGSESAEGDGAVQGGGEEETGTTGTQKPVLAGYAVEDAAEADSSVLVKLAG